MLADGTFFEGIGFGAPGTAVGEVCFNTAMTGYQEILSDPSYAGQIVAFTFPHIGIVGTNAEDIETITPAVRGLIVRADAEHPSNYRSLAGAGPLAEVAQHPGGGGHRHPRADQPDPRKGHAAWRDRQCWAPTSWTAKR